MTLRYFILALCLCFFGNAAFGQDHSVGLSGFPFLDKESQSNVVVTVSDLFGDGVRCPIYYTNVLANTNLFTALDQGIIGKVLVNYVKITTNSGPPGTVLIGSYRTNSTITTHGRTFHNEKIVLEYRYTNCDAHEEVSIGNGFSARHRTKDGDGYNVLITLSGDGSILQFMQIRHGLKNGVFAEFCDGKPQGMGWDYQRVDFTDSRLVRFIQYTNGLVFGKYLLWHPRTGNLMVEADFKQPCDLEKHRTDSQWFQGK